MSSAACREIMGAHAGFLARCCRVCRWQGTGHAAARMSVRGQQGLVLVGRGGVVVLLSSGSSLLDSRLRGGLLNSGGAGGVLRGDGHGGSRSGLGFPGGLVELAKSVGVLGVALLRAVQPVSQGHGGWVLKE